jgi:hypothetical protein
MKLYGKKALACLSLMLVVLSVIPSGAISNETGVQNATDIPDIAEGKFKGREPIERSAMEIPEFETEEQEMAFLKEKTVGSIEKRIDMAENMLENIDGTDSQNGTAESLEEEVSELKILLEKINSATTLEELKELMSESMKMGKEGIKMGKEREMMGKGPGKEIPEFETEEEELEFVKARTEDSVERMIETLGNIDVEKTDSANMTSEDVEAILVQLEDIKSRLNSEDLTLEDLQEIKESMSAITDSIREACPAPANERGAFPGHHGNREGLTA